MPQDFAEILADPDVRTRVQELLDEGVAREDIVRVLGGASTSDSRTGSMSVEAGAPSIVPTDLLSLPPDRAVEAPVAGDLQPKTSVDLSGTMQALGAILDATELSSRATEASPPGSPLPDASLPRLVGERALSEAIEGPLFLAELATPQGLGGSQGIARAAAKAVNVGSGLVGGEAPITLPEGASADPLSQMIGGFSEGVQTRQRDLQAELEARGRGDLDKAAAVSGIMADVALTGAGVRGAVRVGERLSAKFADEAIAKAFREKRLVETVAKIVQSKPTGQALAAEHRIPAEIIRSGQETKELHRLPLEQLEASVVRDTADQLKQLVKSKGPQFKDETLVPIQKWMRGGDKPTREELLTAARKHGLDEEDRLAALDPQGFEKAYVAAPEDVSAYMRAADTQKKARAAIDASRKAKTKAEFDDISSMGDFGRYLQRRFSMATARGRDLFSPENSFHRHAAEFDDPGVREFFKKDFARLMEGMAQEQISLRGDMGYHSLRVAHASRKWAERSGRTFDEVGEELLKAHVLRDTARGAAMREAMPDYVQDALKGSETHLDDLILGAVELGIIPPIKPKSPPAILLRALSDEAGKKVSAKDFRKLWREAGSGERQRINRVYKDAYLLNSRGYYHTDYGATPFSVAEWSRRVQSSGLFKELDDIMKRLRPDRNERQRSRDFIRWVRVVHSKGDTIRTLKILPDQQLQFLESKDLPKQIFNYFNRGKKLSTDVTDVQVKKAARLAQRALGQEGNYAIAWDKTASLLVRDIGATELRRRVVEAGKKAGVFFTKEEAEALGKKGLGSDLLAPVRELEMGRLPSDPVVFTDNLTGDVLEGAMKVAEDGFLTQLAGVQKLFLTVGSFPTTLRNFKSGFLMAMSNGSLHPGRLFMPGNIEGLGPGTSLGRAGRLALFEGAAIRGGGKRGRLAGKTLTRAESSKRESLGVVRLGNATSEFQNYLEWSMGMAQRFPLKGSLVDAVKTSKAFSKGAGIARGTKDVAIRMYIAGDDFWKNLVYEDRMADLEWATKGRSQDWDAIQEVYGRWVGDDAARLGYRMSEVLAANTAKDTVQHYPRSPRIAKMMTKNPFVAPFATFQYEMPRNIINGVNTARRDWQVWQKTGNPKFKALAVKRMSGIIGAAFANRLMGMTSSAIVGVSKEGLEGIRNVVLPTFSANSNLMVTDMTSGKGDGDIKDWRVSYFDPGQTDPYNQMQDAVNAFLRPGDFMEKTKGFLQQMDETYLNVQPLVTTLIEPVTGRRVSMKPGGMLTLLLDDETGGILGPPVEDPSFWGRLGKMLTDFSPGSITRVADLWESVFDGVPGNAKDEWWAQTGTVHKDDARVGEIFSGKLSAYNSAATRLSQRVVQDIEKELDERGAAIDPVEIRSRLINDLEPIYRDYETLVHRQVNGLRAMGRDMGVPEAKIESGLWDLMRNFAGVRPTLIGYLVTGREQAPIDVVMPGLNKIDQVIFEERKRRDALGIPEVDPNKRGFFNTLGNLVSSDEE